MSFRTRALIAMLAAALAPLALFAAGVRSELADRLTREHHRRVAGLVAVVERDLARTAGDVGLRLATLAEAMPDDDRLRLELRRDGADRRYLIDWAGRAMRLAGLDALQLQDSSGRILSSGHFRNDFDRLSPALPNALEVASDSVLLVHVPTADGPMLALARGAEVRIGGANFVLVGGVRMEQALLDRFATGDLRIALDLPDHEAVMAPGDAVVASLDVPLLASANASMPFGTGTTRLRVFSRGGELALIRRSVDRWFAAAALLVAAAALGLGAWLSVGLTRPLAELAEATGSISLMESERLPATHRSDEIGLLARRLGSMSRRLRTSAAALRDAERRATVGEVARQVNHDVKNGLVPIRNVLRHLDEVRQSAPEQLPDVFGERRHTLEASVGYLDALARRYARLAPRVETAPIDVAGVVRESVGAAQAGGAPVRLAAGSALPRIHGDALALRRILDNLIRNAAESLTSESGVVTVHAEPFSGGVRLLVSDTGCGMSDAELSRAFDDFHTTKPLGTGLGLSVVRRLTSDLGGRLRIESAPGRGTTVVIELPAAARWGDAAGESPRLRVTDTRTRIP